jgi:anti-sigma factor RsiW
LNCQKALEMIHSHIDRELDETHTTEIKQHLEQCPGCNVSWQEQLDLRSALQDDSFYHRAPADFKERLKSTLQKEVEATKPAHTGNSSEVISLR